MQYVTAPSFLITSMAAKIVTMESKSFNWMVGVFFIEEEWSRQLNFYPHYFPLGVFNFFLSSTNSSLVSS